MILDLKALREFTAAWEPWWTVVAVPIWQEVVFRYLPFRFWYLGGGSFWTVGVASSVAFAAIHWYFGIWFVLWAFFASLIQWWITVKFGLAAAILTHAVVNVVDLVFGLRSFIIK